MNRTSVPVLGSIARLWKIPFVRDVAVLQVGKVIPAICGLLSSILFARMLGIGGYGEYAVVMAFTSLAGFFTNLGQQTTTLTFLAEAYGKGDREKMRRISQYYVAVSGLSVLLLIILLPVLPLISLRLYGSPTAGKLGQIVLLASVWDPLFNYVLIVLQVVREIRTLTVIENIYTILQLAVSVGLLAIGWGVAGILVGSFTTSILSFFAGVWIYRRLRRRHALPAFREMLPADMRSLGHFFRDGIWITLDKNIGNLYPNIFLFVLSLSATPAVVGLVRLAYKFASLPTSYVLTNVSRMAASVLPTIAARNPLQLHEAIARLGRYSLLLHIGVSLMTAVCVPVLFPVFYGNSFAGGMYPFFVIITLNLALVVSSMVTPILRLFSKIYYATILNVFGIAAGIGTFFLLHNTIGPVRALYVTLALFQACNVLVIFPVTGMLRQLSSAPHDRLSA